MITLTDAEVAALVSIAAKCLASQAPVPVPVPGPVPAPVPPAGPAPGSIAALFAAAPASGTVILAAGKIYLENVLLNKAITILGADKANRSIVSGPVGIEPTWGKSPLLAEATDITFENLIFADIPPWQGDTSVSAICADSPVLHLTARNCLIRNCAQGIRSINGMPGLVMVLEDVEVADCGTAGKNHNIYLGDSGELRATRLVSHTIYSAHCFKSRMPLTTLTDCQFISNSDGRCLDVPDGGAFEMIGGLIQKNPSTGQNCIDYAMESGKNTQGPMHLKGVTITNNRDALVIQNGGLNGQPIILEGCTFVGKPPTYVGTVIVK